MWKAGDASEPPTNTVYTDNGVGFVNRPDDSPRVLAAYEQIAQHPTFGD